jgi:hypothetical protein
MGFVVLWDNIYLYDYVFTTYDFPDILDDKTYYT